MTVAVGLPEQVTGVALLNSAGQFAAESRKREEAEETVIAKFIVKPVKEIFQRVVLGFLFWQAKQPSRIESVLKSVMSLLTFVRFLFHYQSLLLCTQFFLFCINAGVHKHC